VEPDSYNHWPQGVGDEITVPGPRHSGTQSRSNAGHAVGPPTALVPEAGGDSTHRRDAPTGEGLPHRNRQSVPASRARPTMTATCRWSSDSSFDAGPFVGRLRRVEVLNHITAKYATLRNRVSAAHRGILMSREVSGGGLAHQGHTPSTSGSRASRCVFRALSSANVRNRVVATVRAVGEGDMIGIPTVRDSHPMTEALTAIKVTAWALRRTRLSGQEWPGGSAELVAIRSVDRG
jgi:hypothetical protein